MGSQAEEEDFLPVPSSSSGLHKNHAVLDPSPPAPAVAYSGFNNLTSNDSSWVFDQDAFFPRLNSSSTSMIVDSAVTTADGSVLMNDDVDSGNDDDETMQRIFFLAYGIIGPLIIVVGLLGNSLTLRTFLGRTPVWSNGMTYTYLKWMAITDSGALIMAIPMEVRLAMPWRKLSYWEAFYQAHVELPVLNSFMGSSIFIVVCLTGTRFLALFQPARYRTVIRTNMRAQVAVALAVVLAIALSAPLVMLKEVTCDDEGFDVTHVFCRAKENVAVTHRSEWKAFIVVSEGIVRVGPVIMLTILNVAMIFKFRSVAARRRAISTRTAARLDSARAEERHKLILMSTIVVLFVCFNSPSAVLSIIYQESLESKHSFQIFRAMSNDCELANFAVNFYAYFLCSRDFRNAFFASFRHRHHVNTGIHHLRHEVPVRKRLVVVGNNNRDVVVKPDCVCCGLRDVLQMRHGSRGSVDHVDADADCGPGRISPDSKTEVEKNVVLVMDAYTGSNEGQHKLSIVAAGNCAEKNSLPDGVLQTAI